MPHQRIYELIARKLSGEATKAELDELQVYLQENGGEQYVYEILSSYWQQHPNQFQEAINDEEESFQRILHATSSSALISPLSTDPELPRKIIPLRRWLSIAAIAIGVAGSALIIYQFSKGKANDHPDMLADSKPVSEVVARAGSRSKLILPDSSVVWLNADSRITYHNNFNTDKREVNLEGEAFFDVRHDVQRPFIVHTSGIDIKVLGTAFNVKSYASDETIEATLLRGSIEVVRKNDPNAPKVILRPHEKLVFSKEELHSSDVIAPSRPTGSARLQEPAISVTMLPKNKPDSIIKETSWLYNKLNFYGDSFEELAAKMERWYDVRITINNDRLKRYRLKGSFETETIREALEALQIITPFEYRMEGREIVIR